MANMKEWLNYMRGREKIIGVVIGEMGWGDKADGIPQYKKQPKNKVLTWKEAEPLLDYTFDPGYGTPGCNAIYAWTKNWIIAISQYDGATTPFKLPRNPRNCKPEMTGG